MRKKLSLPITIVAISLSLFQLYQAFFGIVEAYFGRSLHLAIALVLIFLIYPLSKKEKEGKLSFGIDMLLATLALSLGLYMSINHLEIVTRGGAATTLDLFMGGLLVLLVLETTRRTLGVVMVVVIVVLLVYTLLGPSMPAGLLHPGATIKELLDFNFTQFEGVLGLPMAVLVSYIFIFFIFASFLIQTKVHNFFKDFSYAAMGSQTGGIGKVAVLSSAFMGSISGSAVANVTMTGSYTIPAMKESGYPPTFAGAIEAAASTGGQFMPPIMAAAGFLVAAFVGIPYIQVALAAAIPAILYFTMVGISVHACSVKRGLGGMAKELLPRMRDVLKRMYLLLPIGVMVYVLFLGYTPMRAGIYAIIAIVLVSFISKETRLTPKRVLLAFEDGARGILQLTATCAAAGIIILLILLSGLGYKMPFLITQLAGDSLFIALVIVAIGSLILTLGMTTTAGYVIGATLMAPVLITQYNAPPLAAHLFVLYFAIMGNVTPPVALASYTAASIAGASLWRTTTISITLAMAGLVIPFLFIKMPGLLFEGSFYQITSSIIIALMAITSLALAIHGFLWKKVNALLRVLYSIIPIIILLAYYLPGYNWLIIPAFIFFVPAILSNFPWQKLRTLRT